MRWLFVISVALAIGCRDPAVTQLEAIRDEICACTTAACGQEAMKRLPALKAERSPRTQKVARAMLDCLQKLYLKHDPTTHDHEHEGEGEGEGEAAPSPGSASAPGSAAP